MKKVMIGVLPLIDSEKDSYWMLPAYFEAISEAGAIPVMLPLTIDEEEINQFIESFDGFLFTGGQDVSPKLYGEYTLPVCGEINQLRDTMETILLKKAYAKDIAVLGICRGNQVMNAIMGGTLYQDIPTQFQTSLEHNQSLPHHQAIHGVDVIENTPLYKLLKEKELNVNSFHHQAIKVLSDKFKVMAYAKDHLIEAIYAPDKRFIWGIQWHPEYLHKHDSYSKKIFEAFVNACK